MIPWEKSLLVCTGAPPGLKRWQGSICSELVHLYTILGGFHVRFSKRLVV